MLRGNGLHKVGGLSGWRKRAGRIVVGASAMLLAACASQPVPAAGDVLAETSAGTLRGAKEDTVSVYRGIPYALAPMGARRWAPPEPFPDWEGVREAKAFGPACPQPEVRQVSIYDTGIRHTDEDCLSLNIWAPEDAQNAPVFVWIHGGSLSMGAGSEAMYDGARLAREQGLVVVTLNYRLGVLGYLAHPELSAESPEGISGNYGLMDQIEALKWVNRNISVFGGNPDNVTVAGESAGALSVALLMTSPKAQGLYEKAILQSAYMVTMAGLKDEVNGMPSAEAVGRALTERIGVGNIQALREEPAQRLVDQVAKSGFFPFGVIDGVYLTDQMVAVFDKGAQAKVPVLAGFNEGEIRSLRFLLPPVPSTSDAYEAAIRTGYGELAEQFLEFYPSDKREASMLAATRDAMYGWTAERLAASQTAIGQESYFYFFDHSYPAADQLGLRAFHAAEIPYMFGTQDKATDPWPRIPRTDTERQLSDMMMQYWASFARDGRPVAQGVAEWPGYGDQASAMILSMPPKVCPFLTRARFELHEEVVCRRRAAGTIPWNWNVGILAPPLPAEVSGCR